MKNLIIQDTESLTMSSLDIAELTGKRHDSVLRDIRNMLKELGLGAHTFGGTYLSKQNKQMPLFNLDREHTDCLLTGYSAKARMKVIKRWHELEENKPALTQDDQLLMLAQGVIKLTKERDEAIKTKAQINDKRTATIMGRLGQANKKIKKLEEQTQDAGNYRSIRAMKIPKMINVGDKQRVNHAVLKEISIDLGLNIIKVDDQLYGKVNAYHIDAFDRLSELYL